MESKQVGKLPGTGTNRMLRLIVRRKPGGKPFEGLILINGIPFNCRLGRNGISVFKREGDFKTPAGRYRLLFGYRRADRVWRVPSRLPLRVITNRDGWCDAPADRNYNRPVRLPYPASTETMMREDGLYDVVIVLDHNFSRRTRNLGSAVFLHLTAEKPWTAGCIAIDRALMTRLLPRLTTGTVIDIRP